MEKIEVIPMTVIETVDDILERLRQIENVLIKLPAVIDMAYEYEDRIATLEALVNQHERRFTMAKVQGMKTQTVKGVSAKQVKNKAPAKVKTKMPKKAGLRKAGK